MRPAARIHRITRCLLLGAALCVPPAWSQSRQWWPELDLTLTCGRLNLLVPALTRLDARLPNPQFVAAGALGTVSLHRNLSVSAGYLFADLPQTDQVAHVPLVAITPSGSFRRWSFSDINRFERLLAYGSEPYRYRNRPAADYALGRRRALHLYAADEIFFALSPHRDWNQNRFQIGAGAVVRRSLRFEAYFLQRSTPGGKETSAFGTILTVALKTRRSS
ncbi:DUF2490 domain-containing protein [Acidobacteria bacterium AB60]|nr:DUF2490 domain-containing protein [Acidobacteria bacterium AB60]